MESRNARRQLAGMIAAGSLMLSGCGFANTQVTAETAPPPVLPPPPTTSVAPPPPRPFDLLLNDVDPCELLTPDQRSQLGFDRDPLNDTEGGFGDAPTCSYRNSHAKVGARLSLVTVEGMNVWTSDTAQVEATPVVIEGFPALVIKTPELNLACNVAVDVAEGQHIDVLFRDDGAQPPAPLDQLCAGAQRVAKEAVTTLRNPAPPTSSETSAPESTDTVPSTGNGPMSHR